MLVFPGQEFYDALCRAAAQLFSASICPSSSFSNYRLLRYYPLVSSLSTTATSSRAAPAMRCAGEDFHTDHSNYAAAPKATVLYGIVIPQSGGDTEFASVQAAPMTTSPASQQSSGSPVLKAVHAYRGPRGSRP